MIFIKTNELVDTQKQALFIEEDEISEKVLEQKPRSYKKRKNSAYQTSKPRKRAKKNQNQQQLEDLQESKDDNEEQKEQIEVIDKKEEEKKEVLDFFRQNEIDDKNTKLFTQEEESQKNNLGQRQRVMNRILASSPLSRHHRNYFTSEKRKGILLSGSSSSHKMRNNSSNKKSSQFYFTPKTHQSPISITAQEKTPNQNLLQNSALSSSSQLEIDLPINQRSQSVIISNIGNIFFDFQKQNWHCKEDFPISSQRRNLRIEKLVKDNQSYCTLGGKFKDCIIINGGSQNIYLGRISFPEMNVEVKELNLKTQESRVNHQIVATGNRIYFIGGKNGNSSLKSCEMIEIPDNVDSIEKLQNCEIQTQKLADMSFERANFSSCANQQGEIYVFGGFQLFADVFEKYSPEMGKWTQFKLNLNLNFNSSEALFLIRKWSQDEILILGNTQKEKKETNILLKFTFNNRTNSSHIQELSKTKERRELRNNSFIYQEKLFLLGGRNSIDGEFFDLSSSQNKFSSLIAFQHPLASHIAGAILPTGF